MSKYILGISAFYHDSAAALIKDDEIMAAAQEERFTRKKHDPRFPGNAINYCLEEAFINSNELDAVVFYDNPLLTFDRVIKNLLMVAPEGEEQWLKASRSILGIKALVKKFICQALGIEPKILFTDHHMAHAASAFYPSPFDNAAILTVDGVGEWATTAIGFGQDSKVELLKEIRYPHSIGLLYSAITYYCGFKVNSGEYKLMGLAPYGKPVYVEKIKKHLVDLKEDGSFRLNTKYFGFLDSKVMTNEAFNEIFGGEPRRPESRITRREMDIAASMQAVLEEIMEKLALYAKQITGSRNLVLAGGVALNCVANGIILKEEIFDNIWIQPAAGDAGGALGAALIATYQYFGTKRKINPSGRDSQKGSYLGPEFSINEVKAFLERRDYPYLKVDNVDERAKVIAQAIADGKIVGYMNGRMEFGPRALGARSILGDPRRKETQSIMNLKVKYRESFRPFAPSVLAERVNDYFELDVESPYMLLVANVRKERQLQMDWHNFSMGDDEMLALINQPRSDIPAVTHVDYSARVQTVHPDDKPDFYKIIKALEDITGCGVVANTSFNVRGEPIVCSPKDAYLCFMRTKIDLLIIEDYLLWKDQQPAYNDSQDWRREYELD